MEYVKKYWLPVLVAFAIAFAAAVFCSQARADSTSNAGAVAGSASGAQAATGPATSTVVIDQSVAGSNNQNYPKGAVWGAAPLMLSGCQEGASGQGYSAGATAAFESAVCQSLRMAETYQKIAIFYMEQGDTEKAAQYLGLMNEAIADAGDSADFTYYSKTAGSTAAGILPVGALIWLITLI